jgi:hypothetical protein
LFRRTRIGLLEPVEDPQDLVVSGQVVVLQQDDVGAHFGERQPDLTDAALGIAHAALDIDVGLRDAAHLTGERLDVLEDRPELAAHRLQVGEGEVLAFVGHCRTLTPDGPKSHDGSSSAI